MYPDEGDAQKNGKSSVFNKKRAQKNWEKVRTIFKSKNAKSQLPLYHLIYTESQPLEQIVKTFNLVQTYNIVTYAPNPSFSYLTSKHEDEIDTTGTWVWQAENLMAYFLMKNEKYGKAKTVLELGAGTSGLGSLAFCLKYQPQKIVLTDGKQQNIEYLQMNVKENNLSETIRSQKYMWGSNGVDEKFELILAADCLFFEKYHEQLIETLKRNLCQKGQILLVNPKRGKSMMNFLKKLKENKFLVNVLSFDDERYKENYEKAVKQSYFDRDKDYYYFMEVQRDDDGQ